MERLVTRLQNKAYIYMTIISQKANGNMLVPFYILCHIIDNPLVKHQVVVGIIFVPSYYFLLNFLSDVRNLY